MKWRASKALSRSECSVDSNIWHTLGTISGQLANFPILNEIVLMREKAVSLMTGDRSSKAERHSRFRDSTNTAGKRWKWVLMLLSRMRPLWTRLFSSVKMNKHVMMIYIQFNIQEKCMGSFLTNVCQLRKHKNQVSLEIWAQLRTIVKLSQIL